MRNILTTGNSGEHLRILARFDGLAARLPRTWYTWAQIGLGYAAEGLYGRRPSMPFMPNCQGVSRISPSPRAYSGRETLVFRGVSKPAVMACPEILEQLGKRGNLTPGL